MKSVRTLLVIFDNEIAEHEIPAVRGAIIHKVGLDKVAFHNHTPNGGFIYHYPSIQYKRIGGRPALFCIDEGVDEVSDFFDRPSRELQVSGRKLEMRIYRLHLDKVVFQVWDKHFPYRIQRWVGLNPENLQRYNELRKAKDQEGLHQHLSRILTGNILAFAKGIGWEVDRPIEIDVQRIERVDHTSIKGQKLLCFNLVFTSNVFLPENMGLGKSASLGHGVVRKYREYQKRNNQPDLYENPNT